MGDAQIRATKIPDWFNFRNFTLLFLLYFVQGMPYGFQTRFLPIYLRSQGTSLARLGLIKLLLLPWLLKILWAPLFDWMQSKKKWLLASMFGLCFTCGIGSCIILDNILLLCVILFFLNIFSSTQDIAVDGFAIQLLNDKQLGIGNTTQVVGYKFGSIFGGGVLIWLNKYLSLNGLFLFLSIVYLFSIFCIFVINVDENKPFKRSEDDTTSERSYELHHDEKPTLNNKRNNDTEYRQSNEVNKINTSLIRRQDPIMWLKKLIQLPDTVWIIILAIVYKLGEQGCADQFPLYLVDSGTPVATVGFWSGIICQSMSVIGSIFGGFYLSRFRISASFSVLKYMFCFRLVPMVVELFHITNIIRSDLLGFAAMCSLQLIGGAITTTMFSLMMKCSQRVPVEVQGTHYTLLATLEVMGKLLFISSVGWLSDSLGYSIMFSLFILISALPVLFVHYLDVKNIFKRH